MDRKPTKNRSPRRLRFFGGIESSPSFYGQVMEYAFETLNVALGQKPAFASR
jgi:hypothetical protein